MKGEDKGNFRLVFLLFLESTPAVSALKHDLDYKYI